MNWHCGKHDKIVEEGKTCPGCDTEAEMPEIFVEHGKPDPAKEPQPREILCSMCQWPKAAGARFCSNCGQRLVS